MEVTNNVYSDKGKLWLQFKRENQEGINIGT